MSLYKEMKASNLVYRYIKLDNLEKMSNDGKLYFANPFIDWKDHREGFLHCMARNKEEIMSKHVEKIPSVFKDQIESGMVFLYEQSDEVMDWFGMRCQSWCKDANSENMWKEYGNNGEAVCIGVEKGNLVKLSYMNKKVEGFDIIYKRKLIIDEELKNALRKKNTFLFRDILSIKKENYSFENEYRVAVILLDEKGHYIGDEKHTGINVSIDMEINKFIKTVQCHPLASEEFKKKVKTFCDNKQLNLL